MIIGMDPRPYVVKYSSSVTSELAGYVKSNLASMSRSSYLHNMRHAIYQEEMNHIKKLDDLGLEGISGAPGRTISVGAARDPAPR
jgi:hypothetical protein